MDNLKSEQMVVKGFGTVTPGKNILEDVVRDEDKNIAIPEQAPKPVTNIDDDTEPEAGVQPAIDDGLTLPTEVAPAPHGEPLIKISNKRGFDPNSTAHALSDSDNEGGIARNRSAMRQDDGGRLFQPTGSRNEDTKDHLFEVTGFTIQYTPKGEKGIVSVEVKDYYFSLDEAMKRFKDDIYYMPDMTPAVITRGAPIICQQERQVRTFIEGKWRRG